MRLIRKALICIMFIGLIFCVSMEGQCAALTSPAKVSDVKAYQKGSNSIKIKWKKVKHENGYVIQQYNSKKKKYVKIKVVAGGSRTSWTHKKLRKNSYHKYRVLAYKKKGKKTAYSNASEYAGCGVYSKRSSKTNLKSVKFVNTVENNFSYMQSLSSKKIQVSIQKIYKNKKLVKSKLRWYSSNPSIVSVDSFGNLTAKRMGKALISCLGDNGASCSRTIYVTPNPNVEAVSIPILTFHRVVEDDIKKNIFPTDQWVAAKSDFENQIKYLSDNQFNIISLDEFYEWYCGKKELPENSVCLTIDDGIYETYHIVYPIIKKYNMKMTAFIVGAFTGENTAEYEKSGTYYYLGIDKINEIKNDYPDFDFQSHSYKLHHYENGKGAIYNRTIDELYQDFEENKKFNFQYMAYPYGFVTPDMLKVIPNTGIKMAFGFGKYDYATRNDNIYNVKRVKIHGNMSMKDFVNWVQRWR